MPVVHNCTKAILVWLSPPASGVTNQTVGVWDDEYDGHSTLFNQSISQSALHQKVVRRSNVVLEHMSMIHSLSNNVEASVYTEKRVLEQLWNALSPLGELVWWNTHAVCMGSPVISRGRHCWSYVLYLRHTSLPPIRCHKGTDLCGVHKVTHTNTDHPVQAFLGLIQCILVYSCNSSALRQHIHSLCVEAVH